MLEVSGSLNSVGNGLLLIAFRDWLSTLMLFMEGSNNVVRLLGSWSLVCVSGLRLNQGN